MDIGIGLPSTIPGIPGRLIVDWAASAEQAGFSTLGTIDRVVYANMEPITALAAAAAATERIGLTTSILIGPYRGNGALMAKQLATVDSISEGRLTVGAAVGGRPDDYESTGSSFETRGRDFDAQLAEMRAVWTQEPRAGGAIGPRPVQAGGPPILIGGNAPAAYRRMVEYGAGWIAGGGGPEMFAQGAEQARQAWREGGREGQPRTVSLAYVSLGEDSVGHAERYLGDYYSFIGEYAAQIAAGAYTTPKLVADNVAAFADAGCDELILMPCNPDLKQISLIAEAAGL
ncbi:LLM class flavin-dependent oxidoreductase [Actinomadura barringtoniae]|uniref:LLM class flavin-dependent oxidoreductase n=1 Tax=Actinomadura barringtoniae TaxID=1427535 RepID=A0A939P786_9ACTN|nr:LLM class flavin-dependent oxidoreductase [Actinomadura barringtoniae]MBO2446840.1 LLM class flavin-dependent oxidoreductase [Actinomadura barringtoniae]